MASHGMHIAAAMPPPQQTEAPSDKLPRNRHLMPPGTLQYLLRTDLPVARV